MEWKKQECHQIRLSLHQYLEHPQGKEVVLYLLLNQKMIYPEPPQGEADLDLPQELEMGLGLLQGTAYLDPLLE